MIRLVDGAAVFDETHPGAEPPPTDFKLLNWCALATYQELADDRHGGDCGRVQADDIFAMAYGMDETAMAHFTVDVAIRLNAFLAANERKKVVLATGADQTVSPNSTITHFVATIYNQAMGQNP